jgi:uncharacterized membrane protein YeiH
MHVPVVAIEVGATAFGAFSGVMHATRRGADVVGVLALAVAMGLGGGLMRDIVMGMGPPLAIQNPRYLYVVLASAFLAMALGVEKPKLEPLRDVLDAVLMGFWVVMGMQRAVLYNFPDTAVLFLGVLTTIGGSVLRDILAGERTVLLVPGVLTVSPSIVGGITYLAAVHLGSRPIGTILAIGVTCGLRLGGLRGGWTLPTPERCRRAIVRALKRASHRPSDPRSLPPRDSGEGRGGARPSEQ